MGQISTIVFLTLLGPQATAQATSMQVFVMHLVNRSSKLNLKKILHKQVCLGRALLLHCVGAAEYAPLPAGPSHRQGAVSFRLVVCAGKAQP